MKNLSNSLPVSIDQKHHRWKSLEANSSSNQKLKNETLKKNHIKIVIKNIKNKLEDIKKILKNEFVKFITYINRSKALQIKKLRSL